MKILSLIIMLFVSSCYDGPSVHLTLKAKDYQGKKIEDANVYVDKKRVGLTDVQGLWSGDFDSDGKSRFVVEVTKESEDRYYEPYIEVIQIGDHERQNVFVNATFYSVPKSDQKEIDTIPIEKENEKQETLAEKDKDLPTSSIENQIVLDEPLQVSENKKENQHGEKKNSKEDLSKTIQKLPEIVLTKKETVHLENNEVSEKSHASIFVHVRSKNKRIEQAYIKATSHADENFAVDCRTNTRGRCMLRIPKEFAQVILTISKQKYQKQTHKRMVSHQENLYFDLDEGKSIDVMTKMVVYDRVYPLSKSKVYLNDSFFGETNEIGFLSIPLKSHKSTDLQKIKISNHLGFPHSYEETFMSDHYVHLEHYFQSENSRQIHVAMNLNSYNDLSKKEKKFVGNLIEKQLNFKIIDENLVKKHLAVQERSFEEAFHKGWEALSPHTRLDFLIKISTFQDEKHISFYNRYGKVIAVSPLSFSDQDLKILKNLIPYEGILSELVEKNIYHINLGKESGASLGRKLQVFGMQVDEEGQQYSYKDIADAVVVAVQGDVAKIKIIHQKPRTHIEVGQRVKFFAKKSYLSLKKDKVKDFTFLVKDENSSIGIHGANIYQGDKWLGTTVKGKLILPKKPSTSSKKIRIFKEGYRPILISSVSGQAQEISLQKNKTWLNIESEPQRSIVYVDGKRMGVTPLRFSLDSTSGWVKLKLDAPNGYRDFEEVLEIDNNGTLDLTGPRKVKLSIDIRDQAQRLIHQGKVQKAIQKLKGIDKDHVDYLLAWHDVGRIYSTLLDQPAQAAMAFHKVTSHPDVLSFRDKRFVESHVHEGVSLFEAAKKLKGETALSHFKKSFEILDKSRPYLRFIRNKNQRTMADFYRIAAMQKIWETSKDQHLMVKISNDWQEFIADESLPKEYKENAQVYVKMIHIEQNKMRM